MALTTGLALGEDRLTQVLDDHVDVAERRLAGAQTRIENGIGQQVDQLSAR